MTKEQKMKVLYLTFLPSVRLARRLGINLKDIKDLLEIAYCNETKKANLSTKQTLALLKISQSKLSILLKKLKKHFLTFSNTNNIDTAKIIETALWGEPLSESRLCQILQDQQPKDIKSALKKLIEDEKIIEDKTGRIITYSPNNQKGASIIENDFNGQMIDVQKFLKSIADLIYTRFFSDSKNTFFKTTTLKIKKTKIFKLKKLYKKTIWKRLAKWDEEARKHPDQTEVDIIDLSIFVTPNLNPKRID
jgi:hypothetical protein